MRRSVLVAGIAFLALVSRLPFTSVAQPPAAAPEVNPKILAFLKPVEIAQRDSDLQKKLKERHNVAVKLLEERVNSTRRCGCDSVFEARADGGGQARRRRTIRPAAVLEQAVDIAKLISHLRGSKGFA